MKGNELGYQQRIDHLKASYENAQSVARFLDTKASAVVAGVTAIFGLNVTLIKWFFSFLPDYWCKVENWCGFWLWIPWLMLPVAIAMGCYLFNALNNAYLTLVPRDTGNSKPSPLFPMIPTGESLTDDQKQSAADQESRIELYSQHCVEADALEDYIEQIKQMGRINDLKLKHGKVAVMNLFPFIVSSAGLALLSVFVWMLFKFC